MLTFTQAYQRAAVMCGVATTNTTDINFIKQDINQGLRLFKNAARRYWTRQEKATNMVANQQYYQLSADMVRVTEIRVNSGGLLFPVILVSSEHLWNKLNIIPAMTINLPTYAFVRGSREVGLWPIPASTVVGGLMISYEPRSVDMVVEDVTGSDATVTNGSTSVTFSSTTVTPSMVGRWFNINDGADGNWYQIASYDSTSGFELDNYYQGISDTGTFTIGQAPDIPEDYHMVLPYYAAAQFMLKRKDKAMFEMYMQTFNQLREEFKSTYAHKNTGVVQNSIQDYRYSLFSLPPNPIT